MMKQCYEMYHDMGGKKTIGKRVNPAATCVHCKDARTPTKDPCRQHTLSRSEQLTAEHGVGNHGSEGKLKKKRTPP